jgi:MarR family transcriptional regulator, lower aerobic nicotinate degradation pathway regulator
VVERSYQRLDVGHLQHSTADRSLRAEIKRAAAGRRTSDRSLPKFTSERDGQRRIVEDPPLLNDGSAASGTGLRSYHYRLLAALEQWGPVGQADLGRSTSVDRSDVVALLVELERLGLIERTVNPDNRRRNIVSITPAGRKQLRALDHVVDEIQERVLAPLSPGERRQLTRLRRKLADSD